MRNSDESRSFGKSIVTSLLAVTLLITVAACGGQTRGAEDGGEGGAAQFNRPATMFVGFGPGGGSDQAARAAAPSIGEALGVEVPVVNSPGGNGNAAFNSMLGDPPGESIALFTDGTLTSIAGGTASYEREELQGVCRLQEQSSGILISADGPYENWEDLATAAEESPGELTVGTSGQGGQDDIMLAALAEQGVELRDVPFEEPNERYSALLGGSIDALYEQPGDLVDDLESGQMVLALSFTEEPIENLDVDNEYVLGPDAGVDLSLTQSRGVVTSAEATPEQVEALSDACAATQEDSDWTGFQDRNLSDPDSFMPADEYDQYITDQLSRFEELVEQYNVG